MDASFMFSHFAFGSQTPMIYRLPPAYIASISALLVLWDDKVSQC